MVTDRNTAASLSRQKLESLIPERVLSHLSTGHCGTCYYDHVGDLQQQAVVQRGCISLPEHRVRLSTGTATMQRVKAQRRSLQGVTFKGNI